MLDRVTVDDHNNPSLLVRADGRVVAFYAASRSRPSRRHSRMYYRVTREPFDVRSWGRVRTVKQNAAGIFGYTYPNPIAMADGSTWLFWRGGAWQPVVATTRWRGWSRPRTVVRSRALHRGVPPRPYAKYAGDGDRVHMAFTDGHPGTVKTGVRYVAVTRTGSIETSRGRPLGRIGRGVPSHVAESVYSYEESDGSAWVHDIAVDTEGRPVIVYQRRERAIGDVYRYARWNGRQWVDHPITPAGPSPISSASYYTGGATLDHENPSVVVLASRANATDCLDIETWTTPSHGASWTVREVTSGATQHNWRPVTPRGHPGTPAFWFAAGRYTDFRSFDTHIFATSERVAGNLGRDAVND